ncbi:hypothetical protein ACMA1D_02160 [Streptomyces sp. 796.1]|uniref:hypothetical protein n=1 Tax=Streptomyces sp. 796.1 TaxID=3163029 RepID=UPI0039C8D637
MSATCDGSTCRDLPSGCHAADCAHWDLPADDDRGLALAEDGYLATTTRRPVAPTVERSAA